MNCEEVCDLIAAYSLGTATPEESAAIVEHLASCDLHDDLAGLQATALALAAAADEIEPPAGLLTRIRAAVEAEPEVPAHRRFRGPARGYAIAAVLVAAIAALIAWNLVLQLDNDPADEQFVHFYREGDGDWLRVETVLGKPRARVSLGGLDHLGPGQAYQLWDTRQDRTVSIGVFNTNPRGRWAGDFDFTFFAGDTVAITIEATGGSSAPTGETVVSTHL